MLLPGANTSTQAPRFENDVDRSSWSEAATAMEREAEAGLYWHESLPWLPAAETSSPPFLIMLSMAKLNASDLDMPRERERMALVWAELALRWLAAI